MHGCMCKQFCFISHSLLVLFCFLALVVEWLQRLTLPAIWWSGLPLCGTDGFSFAAVLPKVSPPWRITTCEGCGCFVHLMGLRALLLQRWLRTLTFLGTFIGILRCSGGSFCMSTRVFLPSMAGSLNLTVERVLTVCPRKGLH